MASILGDTTCVTHADRVSSARCPSCRQFYCSECITEHQGKMICAGCLEKELASIRPIRKERRSFPLMALVQFLVAVLVVWMVFYFFAQTLADIPDDFHDGTIWE